jgi:Cupredoxin-like domain
MSQVNGTAAARRNTVTPRRTMSVGFHFALAVFAALVWTSAVLRAEDPVTLQISVKDHIFNPAELAAPANKPIVLRVKNLDATPMEFESASLRVEKVVVANSDVIINLRPLQPGRYSFFDDFHQQTAGVLVVQ